MVSFNSKSPTKQKAECRNFGFYILKKMGVSNCYRIISVKSTKEELCIN